MSALGPAARLPSPLAPPDEQADLVNSPGSCRGDDACARKRDLHLPTHQWAAILHARRVYSSAGMRSLGDITCGDCWLVRIPRNEAMGVGRYVPSKGDIRYDHDNVIFPPSSIGGNNGFVGASHIDSIDS